MALLTTWTAANRVITTEKVITYSRSKIYGSWRWGEAIIYTFNEAWEYHRYCTKTYSYVGLTKEAAMACATAMVEYYTRSTKVSYFASTGPTAGSFLPEDGGTVCMADVSPRMTAGGMWQVDISVREDDARLSRDSVPPDALFTTENAREYDED